MRKRNLVWILPLVLSVLFIFIVQFSQPSIIGADGHLHGRLALMILKKGFLDSLPQAHFTWFANTYSDKDFLYHLYLLPFVGIFGYEMGTKVGAFIATVLLFYTVLKLLFVYGKNQWTSWFGITLFLSAQFLRDTAEARPFVFAIALTLLGIHALISQNKRSVFIVSLLYGMTHMSAWIVPAIAIFYLLYDWLLTKKLDFQLVIASITGLGLSFLLHPNFPKNIFYFYLNGILVPVYAAKTGVLELGAEFFPLYSHDFIKVFPVLVAGGLLLILLRALTQGRLSHQAVKWCIALLFFLPLSLVAKRNITHMYPIAVIFFGISFAETFRELRFWNKEIFRRVVGLVGFVGAATVLYGFWQTSVKLSNALITEQLYSHHFKSVAQVLHTKAKTGSRIFHTNWSDSQYLIGLAPEYEYIVTLDPIYMYSFNKDLYSLYRRISFGKSADPYIDLQDQFGVVYGYAGKNYFTPFIEQVKNDSHFVILGEDELGMVFALNNK